MEIADAHAFERAWDKVLDITGAIEDSPEEKELVEIFDAMEEYGREHTF